MFSLSSSVLALSLALVLSKHAALAKQCVQFDTSWNLYAFGGSSDVNLGQNTTWGSPSPTTLTTTGRPPWTGNNTQCFLSQYNNAMYVLDADSSNANVIYVYNFVAGTWSSQTTSGAPDLTTGSAVLDHDTNVFYALPAGSSASLYQLDFSSVTTSATSETLGWESVENPSFSTTGYVPVMAEASNHINFFGVPGTAAGSTDLFVIHFSYFQPDAQTFAETNGASANFPDSHGVAIGIPYASNDAGDQMVFVPDDFSNTFVVTHWTSPSVAGQTSDAPAGINSFINTTQTLPAPTAQDPSAAYAASDTSLVQLDSAGDLYYITGAFGNGWAVSSSATWTKMSYTLAGLTGSVTTSNSTSTTSSSSSSSSSSATGSATGSSGSSAATTGASSSKASSAVSSATSAAATSSKAAALSQFGGLRSMGIDGLILVAATGLLSFGLVLGRL